jgi:hypothetical protein
VSYLVKMRVRVLKDGRVGAVRVDEKPEDSDYVAAATSAMSGFLFEPGRDAAGQALECEITYRYRYEL